MGKTWICSRCGVTASFAPGSDEPLEPSGWAQTGAEWRCLSCRRLEAVEATGATTAKGAPARRRRALTEFELLRDPAAPDRVIAKRANCPTTTVVSVRAALRVAGRLGNAE
jgi:hypothetical protein